MSNIEDTIGRGLSKVQDSFDKSKGKVEMMKEVSRLNKIIEEVNYKKAEVLLAIGMDIHRKVRAGLINDECLIEKCESIVGFDYIVYDSKKKIAELKSLSEGFKCSCGQHLNHEDKFCGGCGKKVEIVTEETNLKVCKNCDASINDNANFCPCCGIQIEKNKKSQEY
ncbi:MAG: zinc ribbon domain-containing protein [Romboutsia sp.]